MADWRRQIMGVRTVLGLGPRQGFFAPYRYADQVVDPGPYLALEPVFRAARSGMVWLLDDIDAGIAELAALDGPPPRPRWGQSWFPRLDGAAAWAILRRAPPARIVEVGSGHSTRMLAYAAPAARITCIDPAPRAALAGLEIEWLPRVLAPEDTALFAGLKAGDVAFFDSSHLLWPGTDVDMILNRILPVLAPGVLVHLHDILLPDPYPAIWGWRGYTEQLGLAGWLMGAYEVVFSSHYAVTRMDADPDLPLPEGAHETSLWLRRR